jgi:hypothetical protein
LRRFLTACNFGAENIHFLKPPETPNKTAAKLVADKTAGKAKF